MATGIRNPAEYMVAAFRGATDLDSSLKSTRRVCEQLKMMKAADGCPYHWVEPLDDVIQKIDTALTELSGAQTRLKQLSKTGN